MTETSSPEQVLSIEKLKTIVNHEVQGYVPGTWRNFWRKQPVLPTHQDQVRAIKQLATSRSPSALKFLQNLLEYKTGRVPREDYSYDDHFHSITFPHAHGPLSRSLDYSFGECLDERFDDSFSIDDRHRKMRQTNSDYQTITQAISQLEATLQTAEPH